MNERIKLLAEQAGFTNAYTDPKEGFELVFVDEEHTTESVEKFAELIVQECVNVLHDNELHNRHISHVLREHFGVEE